jgi:antitoxin component YwqK of YwqJK toxin-antitoxin module
MITFKSVESQTNFYHILTDNTIKVYYNKSAEITIEKYADYYRIGTIDSTNLLFHGPFTDFDINGNKVFSGNFSNNKLEGEGKYFFEDGKVKEQGKYINGVRDSIWTFFHPNGQIEKVINFKSGTPYVISLYKSNGKQLIVDGTGDYVGSIIKNNGKTTTYKIKGELLKGKLDGKWTISGVTQEIFKNGEFVEGNDVLPYTSPQQIHLDNILGFYCHENLTLFQNIYFCNSCIKDISWALYEVSGNINNYPFETYLSKFHGVMDSLNLANLSQIIEFEVATDGSISNIDISQSNNSVKNILIQELLKSIEWTPLQCEERTSGFIYLMVVYYNGKSYLQQPITITNNLEANFMMKQMQNNNILMCQ